jgi:hypothetical protein
MGNCKLTIGQGRTKISLLANHIGNELIVLIHNENAHIGAVAIGEYDHKEERASCSVITRLGHKDDTVAYKAALSISKHTKKPVCVITGIHIDNITRQEIDKVLKNANSLVDKLLAEFD